MTTIRREPARVAPDWKERVTEALQDAGLLPHGWLGAITLHCSDGKVGGAKREEHIK